MVPDLSVCAFNNDCFDTHRRLKISRIFDTGRQFRHYCGLLATLMLDPELAIAVDNGRIELCFVPVTGSDGKKMNNLAWVAIRIYPQTRAKRR